MYESHHPSSCPLALIAPLSSFGVTQMTLGIVVSAYNAKYMKQPYDFYYEFIPRIVFLTTLFGYLVFMIFLKWLIYFPNTAAAPNLLILFIGMFLHPFSLSSPDDELFPGQLVVQNLLLFTALLSVPVMLIAKPYFLRRDHLAKQVRKIQQSSSIPFFYLISLWLGAPRTG